MLPLNCARHRITAAFAGRGRPWTKAHAFRSRGLTQCGWFDRSVELASRNQGHLALHFVLPFNVHGDSRAPRLRASESTVRLGLMRLRIEARIAGKMMKLVSKNAATKSSPT
jgi:hypothetical protein